MIKLQKTLDKLKQEIVSNIYMSEDRLIIQTKNKIALFTVWGDCCSNSYFYDFIGVKDLLNKQIVSIEEVGLTPSDIIEDPEYSGCKKDKKCSDEDIEVYGYQINYLDPKFGDRTAVFSFRNYSNGYYGGWMDGEIIDKLPDNLPPLIIENVLETQAE